LIFRVNTEIIEGEQRFVHPRFERKNGNLTDSDVWQRFPSAGDKNELRVKLIILTIEQRLFDCYEEEGPGRKENG